MIPANRGDGNSNCSPLAPTNLRENWGFMENSLVFEIFQSLTLQTWMSSKMIYWSPCSYFSEICFSCRKYINCNLSESREGKLFDSKIGATQIAGSIVRGRKSLITFLIIKIFQFWKRIWNQRVHIFPYQSKENWIYENWGTPNFLLCIILRWGWPDLWIKT